MGLLTLEIFPFCFDQTVRQKEGLFLIAGNIFNSVKHNLYEGLFELLCLLGNIVKVTVFLIQEHLNALFHIFFSDGFRWIPALC